MCYPVCAIMHIKEPLLIFGKSSLCGGSGFPLSLSEWSFTICLMPYNRKWNVLSASVNKTFPSFKQWCNPNNFCIFNRCQFIDFLFMLVDSINLCICQSCVGLLYLVITREVCFDVLLHDLTSPLVWLSFWLNFISPATTINQSIAKGKSSRGS